MGRIQEKEEIRELVNQSKTRNDFNEKTLLKGETIEHRARPKNLMSYLWILIWPGTIPGPFAWLWGAIDFGILIGMGFGGVFGEEPFLPFILIPFFAIHLAPVWIYLYGIIKAVGNLNAQEYIITNERIFFRSQKGQPYIPTNISKFGDVQIVTKYFNKYADIFLMEKGVSRLESTKLRNFSEAVGFSSKDKRYTIANLDIASANKIFRFFNSRIERGGSAVEMAKNGIEYETRCTNCGGHIESGKCIYCGAKARIRSVGNTTTTGTTTSRTRR